MDNKIITPYPVSTNRYYRVFRNITTLSKEGKLFKETVRFTNLKYQPTLDDISLDITIHAKLKKNGTSYTKIIDLDNSLKCILDSLIGLVYQDDKQVKELHVRYGEPKQNGGATVIFNIIS
jgi:crossover junction endodeoxyribonuclease RusA